MEISFDKYCKEHFLPKRRIKANNIAEVNPEWKARLKEQWWEAENIKTIQAFTEQRKNLKESNEGILKLHLQFCDLHNILLTIGGSETCFPIYQEDIDAILDRGKYYSGRSRMMKGQPSQCHRNSCELWENNYKDHDVAICTGYALSADGMWRQHSWLVWRKESEDKEVIIETTKKRVAYYGFEMTEEEAKEFCRKNF